MLTRQFNPAEVPHYYSVPWGSCLEGVLDFAKVGNGAPSTALDTVAHILGHVLFSHQKSCSRRNAVHVF